MNRNARVFRKSAIEIKAQEQTAYYEFSRIKGAACVILNGDDHGYCKVKLDPVSVEWLKDNLNSLEDDLTRMIVWRSLWDSVRDARLSAVEFLQIVVKHLPNDDSTIINDEVLDCAWTGIEDYCPYGEWQKQKYSELFSLVMTKTRNATTIEDVAFFKDRLIWFARAQADIMTLVDLMKAPSTGIEHFDIGEDYKWRILQLYASLTDDAWTLVEEAAGDSDTAQYGKL